MTDYAYDGRTLDEVAARLYDAMPAMYRVPDQPPAGRGDLAKLLEVLAAPLAVLRQSIEELNADLFAIDSAADFMVPYLAAMVERPSSSRTPTRTGATSVARSGGGAAREHRRRWRRWRMI